MHDTPPIILIVDDAYHGRVAMESTLEGRGYRLHLAVDGFEALNMAETLLPDLILLDVMLPGMDGFEVCRRIRENPRLAEVPIILVTALDDRNSRLHGLEVGADDFLTKPVDRTELLMRVSTITRLNRYRRVQSSYRQLQQLTRRLVEIQETERRALAAELHDDLGQMLTGLKLLLEMGLQLDAAGLQTNIREALALVRELVGRVRELALDLRPSILDDVGLFPALAWLCERFQRHTGISVQQGFDRMDMRRFAAATELAAFRIVQEALTNIARHAHVREAAIDVQVSAGYVEVDVRDRGAGFDPAGLDPSEHPSSGLLGMRERAAAVGGELIIQAAPDIGTLIRARLPLQPPEMQQ